MLITNKLAETFLETSRANAAFRGVRCWRVVEVQHFPDFVASSIEYASELTSTGLAALNFDDQKFYVARLNVLVSDLTKTQVKSLIS